MAVSSSERRRLSGWQETLLSVVIALVLSALVKTFLMQAFFIPSPSMRPQLVRHDRRLVEKMSYWGHSPRRGDIVVFKDPGGWLSTEESGPSGSPVHKVLEHVGLYPAGGHLVKRVIGVGGDHVHCCNAQHQVTVNGHPLDGKTYLFPGAAPSEQTFDVTVPSGHLWVMGDNRGDSCDSRCHLDQPGGGFVADSDVVGKVFALAWPLGRAQLIHRPPDFTSNAD